MIAYANNIKGNPGIFYHRRQRATDRGQNAFKDFISTHNRKQNASGSMVYLNTSIKRENELALFGKRTRKIILLFELNI